ncbi:MAG: HAMP domain-containing histidine kinase [Ignavibacteriales bacterium]|nr:HAMP domain-containing histidine kinase [Ignavibacteriales bacterium]
MRGFRSAKIKIALLTAAFLLVVATLFYTQSIVDELKAIVYKLLEDEKKVALLYATTIEHVANSESPTTDFEFFFDKIIPTIDFPIIETDASDTLIKAYRNITLDSLWTESQRTMFLREMVREMDTHNTPIKVTYQKTIVLSNIHFSESKVIVNLRAMITQLQQLPYIELSLGAMFILLAYVGFSYIKRNEQSSIWVGMSKETAHQLGTPLSSIMGWMELLKTQMQSEETTPQATETLSEMENDIQRLHKVAERFSKIGSKPNLKEENVLEVIEKTVAYFQKRLSTTKRFGDGKKILFNVLHRGETTAAVNRELLEWVFENLVKNALDAIESHAGSISFNIIGKSNALYVDVSDTGKGIDAQFKKEVFRPGYSTKERGWGLGLSLCKRIVETYHKGKLELHESKPGKGTTFRIKLPR